MFLELTREFEEQNPNIKVEVEQPPGAYVGVLETTVALAGGVPPNIIHLAHAYSYSFRERGVFMSLNDYIAADPSFEIEDWYPAFLDAVSMDGHIYGIPYNLSTVTMYYSPFRLEASGLEPVPSAAWDEVVAIGSRVTRDTTGDGVPDIWATDAPYAGGFIMEAWVGQSGATYVNEERTEVVVNSPEGVRAYEFLQDLIHTHGIARFAALPEADLFGGRVGWFIRSSSNSRRILDTAETTVCPCPSPPCRAVRGTTCPSVAVPCIPSTPERQSSEMPPTNSFGSWPSPTTWLATQQVPDTWRRGRVRSARSICGRPLLAGRSFG